MSLSYLFKARERALDRGWGGWGGGGWEEGGGGGWGVGGGGWASSGCSFVILSSVRKSFKFRGFYFWKTLSLATWIARMSK